MSNDIDTLSSGEIQPYNEGMPVLAPLSQDNWGDNGTLTNREIDEYQPQGPTLFGSQLPSGTTSQQVEQTLGALCAIFMSDLSSIGYPAVYINAAVQFINANALRKPYQVQKNHNFNLHGENDFLAHAFGNMVQGLSGSPRAKQQFVTACLQWLAKATQKLNSAEGSGDLPRTAPSSSSEAMLSRLSESDYNKVVKINEQAQQRTLQTLAAKHGQYTAQNMIALAQAHLDKLTPAERQHFDQFTTVTGVNWIHLMNCAETIEFLYNASIGSASLPQDGASIAKELAEFDHMLRVPSERARYLKDPQLQARYRALLNMRGG